MPHEAPVGRAAARSVEPERRFRPPSWVFCAVPRAGVFPPRPSGALARRSVGVRANHRRARAQPSRQDRAAAQQTQVAGDGVRRGVPPQCPRGRVTRTRRTREEGRWARPHPGCLGKACPGKTLAKGAVDAARSSTLAGTAAATLHGSLGARPHAGALSTRTSVRWSCHDPRAAPPLGPCFWMPADVLKTAAATRSPLLAFTWPSGRTRREVRPPASSSRGCRARWRRRESR